MTEYLHNSRHRARKKLAFDDLPPSPTPFYYYNLLTVRERRFVDSYIVNLNLIEAARIAGYADTDKSVRELINNRKIRAAIRERSDAVTELASVKAADVRRELKQVYEADATELSGIWKVPCRHCWGVNNQYQYTTPELMYIERAYAYGQDGWPRACVTAEFGPELYSHAVAAYIAAKQNHSLDTKGGDGYSRNKEINYQCPQCAGQGVPMPYICDTRKLSDGGKRLYSGIKVNEQRIEIVSIDRRQIRDLLARDTHVGVEKKILQFSLPRTPEEFDEVLKSMTDTELEQLVANMVDLSETEYEVVEQQSLPAPTRVSRFTRGS